MGRHYTGSAGKITNCQIGVFAAYVSRHGHAFIDRALYLPKAWTDDAARMKAAHVPAGIAFATKPAMARAMIERAIAAKVPFGWVAADSVYGVGGIETALAPWRAKAMCSGSTPVMSSHRGASRSVLAERPLKSPKAFTQPCGSACRQAKARKAQGVMTEPILNWLISMPRIMTQTVAACGRGAC